MLETGMGQKEKTMTGKAMTGKAKIMASALFLGMLLPSGANAVTPADFQRLIADCEAAKTSCENDLWNLIDVTGDGQLTVAEITRFFRFVFDTADIKAKAGGKDTLLFSVLLGPLGAKMLIDNFDYDGDTKVARKELYHDGNQAQMQRMLSRLRSAFEEVASGAAEMAGAAVMGGGMSQVMKGAGGGGGRMGRTAPRQAAPKSQTTPKRRVKVVRAPTPAAKAALVEALGKQVDGCWQSPPGSGKAREPVVKVRVTLRRDGHLRGTLQVLSRNTGGQAGADLFLPTGDSALRAVMRCAPYEMPAPKFASWRVLELSFDPQGVRTK